MRPSLFLILLTVFLFSAAPRSSHAQNGVNSEGLTGRELLDQCNSHYDTEYGFCAGYLSAIANAMIITPVSGERACNLGTIRTQQLIDLYRSYGEIFPENLRGAATKNAAVALSRAFPCKD